MRIQAERTFRAGRGGTRLSTRDSLHTQSGRFHRDIVSLSIHWTALNCREQHQQQRRKYGIYFSKQHSQDILTKWCVWRQRRDAPLLFSEPLYFYKRKSKCLIYLPKTHTHTHYYAKSRELTVSENHHPERPNTVPAARQPKTSSQTTFPTMH